MGTVRRRRAALLCGTALQAVAVLAFVSPSALAQVSMTARPTGGQVVAGSAAIGQTPAQTTINQSSQRAAIDWKSFDVGSQHVVQFNQPNSSAVTLNRVTGPDPSQIAGQIIANGNIIITNPSGVVFHEGAQVNVNSLIASAPGITNQNFMAGRMVFDQAPKPGARVSNAGTITVKQAGLAALVAPQVANSGTINARLGRVVLAGAEAHTIDLYGDGLVSIDVTKQVQTAPTGPDGKPVTALVTNTGTVIADGGSVLITAKAADGIVQNLISAGGTIQANSVGDRIGTVTIAGVGGSVRVEGRVQADGANGGNISVGASDNVVVASTARISANGLGGGGTVALGTTTTRALAGRRAALAKTQGPGTPAGTAKGVLVESGATVSADGSGTGGGGTVTVLSTRASQIDGRLTARAGSAGGDGGVIETSSDGVLALNGTVDAGAPAGKPGTLFLDPYDLVISATAPNGATQVFLSNNSVPPDSATSGTSYITPQTLLNASNNGATNISLYANHDLTVQSAVSLPSGTSSTGGAINGASLLLHANHDMLVNAPITLSSTATLQLQAGNAITLQSALNAASIIMTATGNITQPAGSIGTSNLSGSAANATLSSRTNTVGNLGNFTTSGDFTLVNSNPMTLTGTVSVGGGHTLSLASDGFTVSSVGGGSSLLAPAGTVILQPFSANQPFSIDGNQFGTNITAATLQVGNATSGNIELANSLFLFNVDTLNVRSAGVIFQTAADSLYVTNITGQGSRVSLIGSNYVSSLGSFTSTNGFVFSNFQDLTVNGPVTDATSISLSVSGAVTVAGSITAPLVSLASLDTLQSCECSNPATIYGTISQTGGTISASTQLSLIANGGISQSGGTISTASLTGSTDSPAGSGGGGGVQLGSSGNAVGMLASFTSPGGFTLIDSQSLNVTGPLNGGSAISLSVTGSLTLNGNLVATTVSLAATGDITQSSGRIAGTTLGGNAGGSATLNASNNLVATLGGFSSGTAFSFTDNESLSVTGPVNAGSSLALSAVGGMVLSGDLFSPVVSLTTSGTLSQSGGIISAGTLTGRVTTPAASVGGGIASLTSTGNAIGTLSTFSTDGALTLVDGQALTVSGPVTAGGAVRLTAPGMTFTGLLSGSSVTLSSTGNITQTGGSVQTLNLTGNAANASLTSGSNLVTTLGNFSTTADFSLADAMNLTVTGFVSVGGGRTLSLASDSIGYSGGSLYAAGGTVALAPNTAGAAISLSNFANTSNITASTLRIGSPTTGNITVDNNFTFSSVNTLDLQSGGAITEPLANGITVSTLTGQAASASLSGPNVIGTLGGFATASSFSLNTASPLTVAGPVTSGTTLSIFAIDGLTVSGSITAPTVTLTAADGQGFGAFRQTGGTISASTHLTLQGNGGISQTGGVIQTALLTGTTDFPIGSGGTAGVSLVSVGNAIGTLGAFRTTNGFALVDGQGLTISGGLTVGNTLSLTTAGPLTLAGNVTAGAVTLAVAGDITQPSGNIVATSLTGSATNAALTSSTNQIGTIGAFTTSGNFSLADASNLTINGQVSVGGGQTLSLASDNFSFAAGGSLYALGGTVALAPNTTGAAFGISSFSSTSNITANTLRIGSATTGAISIVGAYDFSAVNVLDLRSSGAITEGAGSGLRVATLTGSANSASFAGTNAIGTLGSFTTSNGFTLLDATSLTVTGPVSGSVVALSSAGNLTLAGTLTAPQVTLSASGSITQTAGSINATVLTGTGGSGPVALTAAGNAIGQLGALNAASSFSLTNGQSLTVTGPVISAVSVALGATGTLILNGNVQAPSVALNATGNIVQPGGSVITANLTGSAANATLGSGTNQVSGLGNFTAAGGVTLADASSLTVNGTVSVGDGKTISLASDQISFGSAGSLSAPGGTVALAPQTPGANFALSSFAPNSGFNASTLRVGSLTTGNISISGSFNFSNVNTLDLRSGAAIIEASGSALQVGTLTGQANSASLGGSNAIGTLGAFATNAGFSLVDTQALTVAGPVSDNTAITLRAGGTLALAGTLSAPSVSLNTTGDVVQSGGAISAGTLVGSVGGAANLAAASNAVGTLGSFSSSNGLTFVDGQTLSVAGPVTDGRFVSLTATGGLALTGAVTAPSVTLDATGDIVQSGGAITAALLSGSGATVGLAQAANQIDRLGRFAASGDFSLADSRALSIVGAVSAGRGRTLSLASDQIGFSSGSITGGSGTLTAAGGVVALAPLTQNAGFVLSSAISSAGITAGTLRIGNGTTGSISILGTNNFSNVGTLDLRTAGAVSEASGASVQVGTLTGQAGSVSLGGGNGIATLGNFATQNDFSLTDTGPLRVAGTVSVGSTLALTTGALTLAGTLSAPTVSLAASGTISQTGGTLTIGTLTGSAIGSAGFGGTGIANISTLGAFSVTNGQSVIAARAVTSPNSVTDFPAASLFSLADSRALVVNGPVSAGTVTISSVGGLTLNGGTISADTASFQVTPGTDGSALTQIGRTTVAPISVVTGQLTLSLPSGGAISLAQLEAPAMALSLQLGSGSASGSLNVASLQVSGSGGAASLTGTVAGQTGGGAATIAGISPTVNASYQLNNCTIAAGCGVITVQQPANPPVISTIEPPIVLVGDTEAAVLTPKSFLDSTLGNILKTNLFTVDLITVGIVRDPSDPELLLPNISDRDY